jgi:hypothetical protein
MRRDATGQLQKSLQPVFFGYPHYPADKQNYDNNTTTNLRKSVCNPTLFANVMAWALRMTEENGINSSQ